MNDLIRERQALKRERKSLDRQIAKLISWVECFIGEDEEQDAKDSATFDRWYARLDDIETRLAEIKKELN